MNKNLYSKLSINNIKKNKHSYFPYIFSSILIIAMFYILLNINNNTKDAIFFGSDSMNTILSFGVIVIGIFSLLFIFYTNSFLMKRRTRELGLYSVLGMEKKHISKVVSYEIIYSALLSIISGIVVGIIFSKLMFAVLLNILDLDTAISLDISLKSIGPTVILFIVIFITVIVYNIIKIYRINPIDLINKDKEGEREPKSNWIMGTIGLITLGAGYYIAITIENPIRAISMFFIAVMLVILGTYLIFTSGSIIFLKLLRKNKSFYYKKNNFISVSNMMYRMKQNAAGLSNIAILSTAVLIILSSTISLYVGMEDIMKTRYLRDINIEFGYKSKGLDNIEKAVREHSSNHNVEVDNIINFYNGGLVGYLEDNQVTTAKFEEGMSYSDIITLGMIPLDDYNRIEGVDLKLEKGEVLFFSHTNKYNYEDIIIGGDKYKIKNKLDNIDFVPEASYNQIVLIVSDLGEIEGILNDINKRDNEHYQIYYHYGFDIEGNDEDKISFASFLREELGKSIEGVNWIEDRFTSREDFLSIYGSLFFIGIFLGTLFMIATVLIIYYKQISEGYEDRKRFNILQKVGMDKKEIKKTIQSQVLLVFFLPLATAIIHTMVAFPLVTNLLEILYLTNVKLFMTFTGIFILVFALGYGIVYRWTAGIYYKIVN